MFASHLLLFSFLPLISAQETVLGVYIFHRHGDRTAKSWPPTVLTDLGYEEVWQSGNFYRQRYIANGSTSPIFGINTDVVKQTQLNIQAPDDTVLFPSALGFLQGLYPPVGETLGSVEIANGSTVQTPLNGYQLITVQPVSSAISGTSAESTTWLQGSSGCNNAIISSNNYFESASYLNTLSKTRDFYQTILPVINTTFTSSTDSFKNAYTIFDYINVATINNLTIPSDDLLTNETLFQLRTLADQHEYGLAYNASEKIRGIAGATLAAQIVQQLNETITSKSTDPSLSMQFGTYAAFFSFFGLADLPSVSINFTGVVDYASSMTFELFTNSTNVTADSYPSTDDINVRFFLANGSAAHNPLTQYPLFGSNAMSLSWSDFVDGMNAFAVGDQDSWCTACGNSTGVCASSATSTSSGSSPSSSGVARCDGGGGGMSKAVAGVIGAMVTLAVILGLEALVFLVGGLRLVSKRGAAASAGNGGVVGEGK